MLIHCYYCLARVDAETVGATYGAESESERYRVSLLKCPSCHQPLVARDELVEDGQFGEPDVWSAPVRVWPSPESDLPPSIPSLIRASLIEANLSRRAGAFTASVVMTGRALEAMCRHFETKSKVFAHGLKELLDREIIDKRLFRWSEELRVHRNLAAHATDEQFSHDDAEDLFTFATAICDYVFVLKEKFDSFMERKEAKKRPTVQEAESGESE
jgi:hypothetical protein